MIEAETTFRGCPDLWSAARGRLWWGFVAYGSAAFGIYWLLLITHDPLHLGLQAQPDVSLSLAAVGALQLGRIEIPGQGASSGLTGVRGGASWYAKSVASHHVKIYRSLLKNMQEGHLIMLVSAGLTEAYKPDELAREFRHWANTQSSDQSRVLGEWLDGMSEGRFRSSDRRLATMVSRLVGDDLDAAKYILSRRAETVVQQHAF